MNNRYLLMRHGESMANLEDRIISNPAVGCLEYGLSPKGVEQARSAVIPGDVLVYASDFLRTQETARAACPTLDIILEPLLRERFFGSLDGGSASAYEQVWALDSEDPSHVHWGVESAEALVKRLSTLIGRLEKAHSGRTILMVSHGDPLRFLQLWGSGRSLRDHLKLPFFEPAEVRKLF